MTALIVFLALIVLTGFLAWLGKRYDSTGMALLAVCAFVASVCALPWDAI